MKKGDILTAVCRELRYPNRGICETLTDPPVFVAVKGALPGQTVSFRTLRKKGGIWHGQLLSVEVRSEIENRENGVCPHAGVCGGCLLQTVSYPNQLKLKEGEMEALFSPVLSSLGNNPAAFSDVWRGILGSPDETAYRNKMEYSFGDHEKDGPMTLGLHRKNSFYDIIMTDHCNIVSADFNRILSATLSFFKERSVPYYHKTRQTGYLRHLLLREGKNTGELLIDLVTTTQAPAQWGTDPDSLLEAWVEAWGQTLLSLPLDAKIAGILHTKNDSISDAVIDQGTEILYGKSEFSDRILGMDFAISPFSFFQTNTRGAEVLYSEIRRLVTDSLSRKANLIYDLYCGTGTITQLLSPIADRVVGVEIVAEAVDKARENAKLNEINNVSFLCDDVFKALDSMPEKPDFIVLDPPRDGVAKKALTKILSYGVDSLVYVSCKPSSLARDLVLFDEAGYAVKDMEAVDMFPNTAHCEVIARLSRGQTPISPRFLRV